MLDPSIDRIGMPTRNNKQKLAIVKWLEKVGFIETYRCCNPQGGKFTWKNSKTQTRIDQIWIPKDLKLGLKKSDIEDMELCTESDHNLIWAKISLDSVLSLGRSYTSNRQKIERKIFLYKDATRENWEDYTGELEKLCKSLDVKKGKNSSPTPETNWTEKEEKINTLWDRIVDAILTAANKHIPSKKIKQTKKEFEKNIEVDPKY